MKYCIYLRKSRTDAEAEQRGEGETLARHEKTLTAFAKQTGLNVSAIYREIVSGESIAARPQMQKLLSEVSEGLWDGVIVMDIDRLARGNSIDQGIISQTFLYANTKIITPSKTYDPTNEFDEEYFEFGLFMSRREYKTINRRLQRGRVTSCKEGKYVCSRAPYGYERVKIKNDKGFTLSPVPEQAEVIKNIFEWYTSGKPEPDGSQKHLGVSLIARELNAAQIKPLKGNVWTSSTIRDILINPIYIGKIRWNWRPQKKKIVDGQIIKERPRTTDFHLFDGIHEAIISEDVFYEAQKLMNQNKRRPIRGDKTTQNPLASLVICKKCGRKMQRRPNPKNPDLLMCAEPTCDNHASYIELVEERVLQFIEKWTTDCYNVFPMNRQIIENAENYHSELSAVLKTEAKVNSQLEKAFEAFETGVYDADTFKKRSQSLKNQLAEINTKKAEIQKYIDSVEQNEKIYSEFIPKVKNVLSLYDTLKTLKEKNDVLKEIVDHIDYIKDTRGHGHEKDFNITVYPKFK